MDKDIKYIMFCIAYKKVMGKRFKKNKNNERIANWDKKIIHNTSIELNR